MKHLTTELLGAALLGGLLAPNAAAQFHDRGRLVDADFTQYVTTQDLEVRVVDTSSGVQATDLFAGSVFTPTEILDVAIGVDQVVAVTRTTASATDLEFVRSVFDGSSWSPFAPLVTFPDTEIAQVEYHDGFFFLTAVSELGSMPLAVFYVYDDQGGVAVSGAPVAAGSQVVSLAAGDGPGGPGTDIALLICTDDGAGTRTVQHLGFNGTMFVGGGHVDTGSSASDFGADVAIDGGWAFIGAPLAKSDRGRVDIWEDDGAGNFSAAGSFSSQIVQPSHWGRVVDARQGILAFSVDTTSMLAQTAAVGGVRLARFDGVGSWTLTGETLLPLTSFQTPHRAYGASLALRAPGANPDAEATIVVGAPGGDAADGLVHTRPIFETPMVELDLSPGLAGFGSKAPWVEAEGATTFEAPLRLSVRDAAPGSVAYLVMGFAEINAPFKGGVLFPEPTLVIPIPSTDLGAFSLYFTWLVQPGPDYSIALQFWVVDPDGPVGFSATPGFRITES